MAEQFVARYSLWKTMVMLVFPIGLTGFGILMPALGIEMEPGSEWKRWALIALGAVGIFLLLRRFFDDRPQIVVDGEGLLYRRFSVRQIPWTDVRDYQPISEWIGDSRRIDVRLHDPAAYLSRFGPRWSFRIRLHGYDRGAEEILDAFARFAPNGLQQPEYREL